jgi:hypothetical protein
MRFACEIRAHLILASHSGGKLMDRMIRAVAITSIISLATISFALVGAFVGVTTTSASAAFDAFLKVTTTDGKVGQVTKTTTAGKTVYTMTINGKPAAPGTYALANGQHVKVGPNGVVDNDSFAWGSKIMLNPQPLPP